MYTLQKDLLKAESRKGRERTVRTNHSMGNLAKNGLISLTKQRFIGSMATHIGKLINYIS